MRNQRFGLQNTRELFLTLSHLGFGDLLGFGGHHGFDGHLEFSGYLEFGGHLGFCHLGLSKV